MMRFSYLSFLLPCFLSSSFLFAQPLTPYEKGEKRVTATYDEVVAFYDELVALNPELARFTYGRTDAGPALELIVASHNLEFDPVAHKLQGKAFVLINNAIHPGEPCGVDASMMLLRDLVESSNLPENVLIGVIPMYNIGGARNRSSTSRANQIGPESYGFRGNARNRDLNRDFMKMDTYNAHAFAELFQTWLPDLFIDTHTTNGADYPAIMTLIETQADKLQPSVASYMQQQITPVLYSYMDSADILMCPYVNSLGQTPDEKGIADFMDLPRYSTGYASLFQTPSYVTEAHMLKSYEERVAATYTFLKGAIETADKQVKELTSAVQEARSKASVDSEVAINWTLDTTMVDSLEFQGYEAETQASRISGLPRLSYNRKRHYTRTVPYYRTYRPTTFATKPRAYIIPQAYQEVIRRLAINGVPVERLKKDTTISVVVYYLDSVETISFPYEGHYLHNKVAPRIDTQTLTYYAGDAVVYTGTWRDPYIVHALEPKAADALFRWNFFDGVLMQKEYFSSYVFEETAAKLLSEQPKLKAELVAKQAQDPDFAANARAQLDFIYKRSPYYEPTHLRYPVTRWLGEGQLPTK